MPLFALFQRFAEIRHHRMRIFELIYLDLELISKLVTNKRTKFTPTFWHNFLFFVVVFNSPSRHKAD